MELWQLIAGYSQRMKMTKKDGITLELTEKPTKVKREEYILVRSMERDIFLMRME